MHSHLRLSHILVALVALIAILSAPSFAQFSAAPVEIAGGISGAFAWGDYDGDGDLDFATAGLRGTTRLTQVYRNDGSGVFTLVASLTGVSNSALAWGDYDNDGDLDLAFCGLDANGATITKLFRYDGGMTFTDTGVSLMGVQNGSIIWADINNDGRLDLIYAGSNYYRLSDRLYTRLYKNNGDGTFSAITHKIPGLVFASVAACDYDRDGNMDLAFSGSSSVEVDTPYTALYHGNGDGTFSFVETKLPQLAHGAIAWGDYDSDGLFDLALAGTDAERAPQAYVFHQVDIGQFNNVEARIYGVTNCSLAWGDHDNDGKLDLAAIGIDGRGNKISTVYHGYGNGSFEDIGAVLAGLDQGTIAWGDYDNDGRSDLAIVGATASSSVLLIYKNTAANANTAPTAPTGLAVNANGNDFTFAWGASTDVQTTGKGLTYNVRIGTTSASAGVVAPMANLSTGYRRVPAYGNAQNRRDITIKGLTGQTYYWRVQAIDSAFAGSAWSASGQITRYKLSGYVKSASGTAISGVTVAASNGGCSGVTDATGYYELLVVSGWSGTITPKKNGFALNPASRSLSNVQADQTGQDFTAPAFQPITTSIPGASNGASAWGDYDNDGDLDVAISGTIGGVKSTRIYRNDGGGVFTNMNAPLVGVTQSAVAWHDYDNDGDLDLAVGGSLDSGCTTNIYRNDAGVFTDINAGIAGIWDGSLAWGDYDNDGFADLAITGGSTPGYITKLYRNNHDGTFTEANAGLVGMASGSLAWADADNDGDLDLMVVGAAGSGPDVKSYKNNGNGTFTSMVSPGAPGWQSAIAWGDCDNDGDLDLLQASNEGTQPTVPTTRLFANNGNGTFTAWNPGIVGLNESSVDLGDVDNDGDLDVAISGVSQTYSYISRVYRNDGNNIWIDMNLGLTGIAYGSVAWGDCDNDGDLDLICTGVNSSYSAVTSIYINNSMSANTTPAVPAGLTASGGPSALTFSWNAATDTQTPSAGLSYNLRVGTAPGKDDVLAGQALSSNGLRKLPAIGNAQKKLSWTIKNLPGKTYYWSVQAIDAQHAGGVWAAEQSIVLPKITGYVRTIGGAPVPGVTVSASNGGTSAVTDSQGAYAVTVSPNWTGTVNASRDNWVFQPASISLTGVTTDQANQNFVAQRFKISGTVKKADGATVSGVTVTASTGGTSYTTDASGTYEVYVTSSWTGTLTASKPGWTFNPASLSYSAVSADLTAQDFTAIQPVFQESSQSFINVEQATSVWGDYDSDGDMDLVLCGQTLVNGYTGEKSKIYRNNGDGTFTDIAAPIIDGRMAAAAWGDYDGDGDLDLALYGWYGYTGSRGKIYRNDGNGVFADSGIVLSNLSSMSIAWGDYDNDGDLDLLANGTILNDYKCFLYRNDKNGVFVETVPVGLPGVADGCVVWGDYDNDGDLDVALAGYQRTEIYKNDGTGKFTSIGAGLPQAYYASLAWGDYDNDGDLDLAECANYNSSVGLPYTKVYRNDGGRFVDIGASFVGVGMGDIDWGDFNSDGYLDLVVSGSKGDYTTYAPDTRIYKNNGDGSFSDFNAGLTGVAHSTNSWVDVDNDGDLDLLVAGSTSTAWQYAQPLTKLYINTAGPANTPPTTPGGVAVSIAGGGLKLSWSAATDAQTPSGGLSYNIRIGTSPGANDAVPGMAAASGVRMIPALGNAQKRLNWVTRNLTPNLTYYCAVQTIDSSYTASPWSAEVMISLFKVSGYVKTAQGAVIAGATITASGGVGQTTTDANGYYQLSVPTGWSGTLTASKGNWQFSPASISFASVAGSLSDQNFTALRHKISGTVKRSGGSPMGNVLVNTSDYGVYCYTDVNGYYEFYVAPGWTGTITPVAQGFLFSPDLRSYTNLSTDMANQNYVDRPPLFSQNGSAIAQIRYGAVAWGDCDNDGLLDLAVAGETSSGRVTKLYHNDGYGEFTEWSTGFIGLSQCSIAWGDYDGDGDLDLVVSGENATSSQATKIYRNDGNGVFADINAPIAQLSHGAVSWADYDNDGDLDLAIAGFTGSTGATKLYRNDGNDTFTDSGIALAPMSSGSMSWADYDKDGDLDLAICGSRWSAPAGNCTLIYRNDGAAGFTSINTSIAGVQMGAVAWGDYDGDGDPDIAVTGLDNSNSRVSRIYRNDGGGVFTDINAQIPALYWGTVAWGDYDNDGDLDLLIGGNTSDYAPKVRICRNDGNGTFVAMDEGITPGYDCAFAWADCDNDGDLDIAYTGNFSGQIYRNDITTHNSAPSAPATVSAASVGNDLVITWTVGSDSKTPASGLSYNLRVGSAPGKDDIYSGMADSASGMRRIPSVGGVQQGLSWTLKSPKPIPAYYFAVQTIDNAFAGSSWTTGSLVRYKVSGFVKDQFDVPVKDVSITGSNGAVMTSDANGYYEMYVSANWSGTITPSKPTFTFNPASRSYTNVTADAAGQNFAAIAPPFETVPAGLLPGANGMPAWGDYDNDGDLDLAICGDTNGNWPYAPQTNIYRNDGGKLTYTSTLPGSSYGAIEWADMDNDDDLDLVFLPGWMGSVNNNTIFRNNGDGSFTDMSLSLGVHGEAVAVGDFNNDGRVDLSISDYDGITHRNRIYKNNGNWTFTDIQANLPELSETSMSFADYDNDGDLDFVLTGFQYGWRRTCVYNNNGGAFTQVYSELPGVESGNVSWGDYDNDGDLDAAICGSTNSGSFITSIYRNDGNGVFVDTAAGLTGVMGCVSWGDYNSDGKLDLAVTGRSLDEQPVSKVYKNTGSAFADSGLNLTGVCGSSAWGDYDGDGDVDLVIVGATGSLQSPSAAAFLYRNNSSTANTAPDAPTRLSSAVDGSNVTFSWNGGTDAQTLAKGLSYNLRVGTAPGKDDVFSANANLASGVRRLPKLGNVQQRLAWTVCGLAAGPYYWSVQAVDSSLVGSEWSPERSTAFPGGSSTSIQAAKNAPDGQAVVLTGDSFGVTAVFGDRFYIEDRSRACGIRVDGAVTGAMLNRSVSVAGVAMTDPASGERYIRASSVLTGQGQTIYPLGMSNSRVGGGAFGLQRGILGTSGLNNVGLLVRVWGIAVKQTDSTFTLNDGSGPILCRLPDGKTFDQSWHFISVVGISSCYEASGNLKPMILIKSMPETGAF